MMQLLKPRKMQFKQLVCAQWFICGCRLKGEPGRELVHREGKTGCGGLRWQGRSPGAGLRGGSRRVWFLAGSRAGSCGVCAQGDFPAVLCSFAVCCSRLLFRLLSAFCFPAQTKLLLSYCRYCSLCFLLPLCAGVTMVTNIYCPGRVWACFFAGSCPVLPAELLGCQGGQSALCTAALEVMVGVSREKDFDLN